ncbi:MAG TPA: prolyl oligopeptidase family serine peptidase, partial [Rhodothermales bacterium]|nr:prolyl oligopeptidase family serine peptidase [Rhodothermales bacterium]
MQRLLLLLALLFVADTALAQPLQYPPVRRGPTVDTLHGVAVADPYRWLEDAQNPETRSFVEAQAAFAERYLNTLPERATIRRRLDQVTNYPRSGVPQMRRRYTFVSRNSGLQNQSVVFVREGGAGERVLLDANTLSEDGTVALAGYTPTRDGRFWAYQLSDGGSDWRTVRVRDVASGQDLPDVLRRVKFSGITWKPEGHAFYYSRYDAQVGADSLQQANTNQKVYLHRIGTPQSSDLLIYERPDHPGWLLSPQVSYDGRYLFIYAVQGTSNDANVFVRDLRRPAEPFRQIFFGDASYSIVDVRGDTLVVLTNKDAPNSRLVAVSMSNPAPTGWRTLIPTSNAVLQGVSRVGDRYVARALEDVKGRLTVHRLDGTLERTVPLPGPGSISSFDGTRDTDAFYFTFNSYTTPGAHYRHDLRTGRTTLVERPRVPGFNPDAYEAKQVFYTSKDGTRIPMFIVHKKGLRLDGSNPTLLYGYGGFNLSQTPGFSASRLPWLERGGVYAVANLRGGGEYGEAWHDAGRLDRKQNVFDDFIAAAEYLIREQYTSPQHLAIQGGSNGGLLVGAVINQRPELFAAAVPQVGVMDMLRFHRFTIGAAWTSDYGSPDDPAAFRYIYPYSPIHNIRPGTRYPATLVTTADYDDRVVPAHSYKYAAALQAAQAPGGPPVILRIETRSGHGASNTTKALDLTADVYAFLWEH